MATMNISLSDKMKDFIQSKVDSGDYNNASEYVRDLIRQEERKSWARQRLTEELQKGLDSGASVAIDDLDTYFANIRQSTLERLKSEGHEIKE